MVLKTDNGIEVRLFNLKCFYWLFTRFNIIRSLSSYSCLVRSFFFSFYTLSAILLLFYTMLWMHVSATVWNLLTYSLSLRVFRAGLFEFLTGQFLNSKLGIGSILAVAFLAYLSRTLMLSGLANKDVIFFWR